MVINDRQQMYLDLKDVIIGYLKLEWLDLTSWKMIYVLGWTPGGDCQLFRMCSSVWVRGFSEDMYTHISKLIGDYLMRIGDNNKIIEDNSKITGDNNGDLPILESIMLIERVHVKIGWLSNLLWHKLK